MVNCRLCCDNRTSIQDFWNDTLIESENFRVIPSLGALIEGWLLLIPKKHILCFGALSDALSPEFEELKYKCASLVLTAYGNVCAFEHGPSGPNHAVGCSVDHAHLHIAPLQFDLLSAAKQLMPNNSQWRDATLDSCRRAFREHTDYLYVEQPLGQGKIATNADFGSQLLRRAIAMQLSIPDRFNWRVDPHLDIVERTVERLSSAG